MNKYKQYLDSDEWEFIPYSKMGTGGGVDKFNTYANGGIPSVEVEKGELIQIPSGLIDTVNSGARHENGGTPMNLPQGSMVLSDRLKPVDSKKTFSQLGKKFETKNNFDMLNYKYVDPIQSNTANLMIDKKNQKLQQLFQEQEISKIKGEQGAKAQKETAQEYGIQPIMKKGGIVKAADGRRVKSNYPEIQYPQTTPTGLQYELPNDVDWMNWQSRIDKSTQSRGFEVPIADSQMGAKYYGTNDPQALTNIAYQEQSYDDALDTPEGRKALARMWDEAGNTNWGKKLGIKFPTGKLSNLNDEDLTRVLKDVRPAYIDSQLDYRKANYITPDAIAKKEEATKAEDNTKSQVKLSSIKSKEAPNLSGLSVPVLGLPNVYARDPLNYHGVQPNYIDPRYLSIQSQLNDITRGQRSIANLTGDRSQSSVGQMLQSQANAYNAQQQAYNTKYNYDRQQDANAQQFNAQAKTQADQFNQQAEYQQLEDPRRRREGFIDTQKRTDARTQQENLMKEQAYNLTKEYINKTFNPYSSLQNTPLSLNQNALLMSQTPWTKETITDRPGTENDTKTYTYQRKNGGKVKFKPKMKK